MEPFSSYFDNPLWPLWGLTAFHASFTVIYACSPVTQLQAQHVIYTLESFKIKLKGNAAYTVTLIMFNPQLCQVCEVQGPIFHHSCSEPARPGLSGAIAQIATFFLFFLKIKLSPPLNDCCCILRHLLAVKRSRSHS